LSASERRLKHFLFATLLQAIMLEPSTNWKITLPQVVSAGFVSLATAALECATARQKMLGCISWCTSYAKLL